MNSSTAFRSLRLIVSTILAMNASCVPSPGNARLRQPALTASAASAFRVKIDNFHFDPEELHIPAGATVTWQNLDDVPHTATSRDEPAAFDSSALDTDDKFSFTFLKPGRYGYFCKVHPHMTGVIIVK